MMKAILLINYTTFSGKKLRKDDVLVCEGNKFISYRHKNLKFDRVWVVENKDIFKVVTVEM